MVFAPVPRDYSFKMNKKEKENAIKSALTTRVSEGKFFVLDSLKFDEIKTKKMVAVLDALKVDSALVVLDDDDNANVEVSAKNIQDVRVVKCTKRGLTDKNGDEIKVSHPLNVYDVMKYENIVITKEAVAKIEEVYA
jgi:large subunit ribosomal protein L4